MKNRLNGGYLYRNYLAIFSLLIVDALLRLFVRKSHKSLPDRVEQILIVKPDHLGDCLLSTAVLPIIKSRYPNATCDYLAGPWSRAVLGAYPEIRKIWYVRHAQLNRKDNFVKKWLVFWKDLIEVIPRVREERYDLILNLRAFGGNLVFANALMGGKFLAGHATGGGGRLLDRKAEWIPHRHEVEHYAEVLALIGIQTNLDDLKPQTPNFKSTFHVGQLPERFFAVHPGAGTPNKKLPIALWNEILRSTDLPIVVCGSSDDKRWLAEVSFPNGQPVIDLVDQLQISDLFAVLNRAEIFHALDSFPAHLASVTRCPQIKAHFLRCSDPEQWRPLGNAVQIVVHDIGEET